MVQIIPGLQTRGIFCLHCQIKDDRIIVGRLWLRDWELLGREISLVDSMGSDRYSVALPSTPLTFPAENVELKRVVIDATV